MTSPEGEPFQKETKEITLMREAVIKEIKKVDKKKYKLIQPEDLEPLVREHEQMKFLPKEEKWIKQWVKDFVEAKRELVEILARRENLLSDLYYSGYPAIHPEIGFILWKHYLTLPGAEPFNIEADPEKWADGFMAVFAEIFPELAQITDEFGNESHIEMKRRIADRSLILPTDTSVLKIEE